MNTNLQEEFTEEQQEVLKSIRVSRIILPIVLGIGVVAYLLWSRFDPKDFAEIAWTSHVTFWVSLSLLFLVIRHIAYALRLRILSEKEFSWSKCIELIFIWEFSSAVSPTSVGGSAVALFVLSQEKLSAAKTTTLVVYSAILDTIFFVGTLPILVLLIGPSIIRPDMTTLSFNDARGYTFLIAYTLMMTYGTLFFYGLFINPNSIKKLLIGTTKIKWLNRYQKKAVELGDNIIIASKEIKNKKWPFHVGAFLSTATAWSCRFILLNCLIIAFVETTSLDFWHQLGLYARLETMFVIMAFSPTPGGSGLAEAFFWGFVTDYIPKEGMAVFIATLWRILTYYAYLLIGAIIIPNWIRNLFNRRGKNKLNAKSVS